jgi:hypothetical protein
MSKLLFTTALVAGAVVAACAHAESPWYVSGDLGGYFREGTSASGTFGKYVTSGSTTTTNSGSGSTTVVSGSPQLVTARGSMKSAYDPGLTGHLAFGRRLGAHFRVEVEVGVAGYDRSTVYPKTTSSNFPALTGVAYDRKSGGDFQRVTEEVNAFYDFKPALHGAAPYVGFGLGAWEGRSSAAVYGRSSAIETNGTTIPAGWPFNIRGGSNTVGFAMLEGGLSLRLNDRWSVVPAYRYMRGFSGDVAHIAKVGFRYGF